MSKKYIQHISESKMKYHKSAASMPYEDKVKIIIELQKIDIEMSRKNKQGSLERKISMQWKINV